MKGTADVPDNVAITPGAGATVATDERTIASTLVQVQRVDEQGATAVAQGQVSVTTSSTSVAAARDTRKAIVMVNRGSANVFVCGSGTATTSHFQLSPGDGVTIRTTAAITAIAASGTQTVHYIEEYDS